MSDGTSVKTTDSSDAGVDLYERMYLMWRQIRPDISPVDHSSAVVQEYAAWYYMISNTPAYNQFLRHYSRRRAEDGI
jgi:hypothetical protein